MPIPSRLQDQFLAFCRETFSDVTVHGQATKVVEEAHELLESVTASPDVEGEFTLDATEVADVLMALLHLADRAGVDVERVFREKFAELARRSWSVGADGAYHGSGRSWKMPVPEFQSEEDRFLAGVRHNPWDWEGLGLHNCCGHGAVVLSGYQREVPSKDQGRIWIWCGGCGRNQDGRIAPGSIGGPRKACEQWNESFEREDV